MLGRFSLLAETSTHIWSEAKAVDGVESVVGVVTEVADWSTTEVADWSTTES
jgi:hypothetical protein